MEKILEMFEEIMATLPRFDTYATLFQEDNGDLTKAMTKGGNP